MTGNAPPVQGTLRDDGGRGVVRLEVSLDAGPAEVWSALTDPSRLAEWLGTVDGDLREGGSFRGHWTASGWEGDCRVELCRPPQRLRVRTSSPDEPDGLFELTLTAEGGGTSLVVVDRGLPLGQLAAYGAGDQIHVEDLAGHLAGAQPCDPRARWQELHPGYLEQAEQLG